MKPNLKIAIATGLALGVMGCVDGNNQQGPESKASVAIPIRTQLLEGSEDTAILKSNTDFKVASAELAEQGWIADWSKSYRVQNPQSPDQHSVEVTLIQKGHPQTGRIGLTFGDDQGVYVSLPKVGPQVATKTGALSISQGGCSPYSCDYPYKLTMNYACVVLDDNPLGYAQKRYSRYGYSTCNKTKYGTTSNPSWRANMCGQLVVCPGVEKSVKSYTMCLNSDSMVNYCY